MNNTLRTILVAAVVLVLGVGEFYAREQPAGADEVVVPAYESGHYGIAGSIDDLRLVADVSLYAGRVADVDDFVALNGHRLRPGLGLVDGVHFAICEDTICSNLRLLAAASQSSKTDDCGK